MESESNGTGTVYTIDTIVPISKNFLKKQMIEKETMKKVNDELIGMCKMAAEKNKLVRHKLIAELNEKKREIGKIKEEEEKLKREEKMREIIQRGDMEQLKNSKIYNEAQKNYDLLKVAYFDEMNNKKEILKIYNDIETDAVNIDIYDIIMN